MNYSTASVEGDEIRPKYDHDCKKKDDQQRDQTPIGYESAVYRLGMDSYLHRAGRCVLAIALVLRLQNWRDLPHQTVGKPKNPPKQTGPWGTHRE